MSTKRSVDVEIVVVTKKVVEGWLKPVFQRPLRINAKLKEVAQKILDEGGEIPGVITLGIFQGRVYLLDGQHRRQAFLLVVDQLLRGEGLATVRTKHFDSMAEMGREFVDLNGQISRMRPDDTLKALEESSEPLKYIRRQLPFVGYDQIRRGTSSPVIGMSALLRSYFGSSGDVPIAEGRSAMSIAENLQLEDAKKCVAFMKLAGEAWGRDETCYRLWSNLNLTLCVWLYRQLVLGDHPTLRLSPEEFRNCLMSLAVDGNYLDFLIGRNSVTEGWRGPCYDRIKELFVKRLKLVRGTSKRIPMPDPEWIVDPRGRHVDANKQRRSALESATV